MSLERVSDVPTSPVAAERTVEPGAAQRRVAVSVCQRFPIVQRHLWFILYLLLYLVFAFPAAKAKPRQVR